MKFAKTLTCTLLIMAFILSIQPLFGTADAATMNTYTSYSYAGLSINSDNQATVSGSVYASDSSYSVSGRLYLLQYKNGSWTIYKSWAQVTDTGSLAVSHTCTVVSGYKYKTKFVTNVNGENVTKYSAEKEI